MVAIECPEMLETGLRDEMGIARTRTSSTVNSMSATTTMGMDTVTLSMSSEDEGVE